MAKFLNVNASEQLLLQADVASKADFTLRNRLTCYSLTLEQCPFSTPVSFFALLGI